MSSRVFNLSGRLRLCATWLFMLSTVLLAGCSDVCSNEDQSERLSPDGKWKVVGFQRNCGATTESNLQVSILPAGAQMPNEPGNVFRGEYRSTNFVASYEWLDAHTVRIEYSPRARPVIIAEEIGPIRIEFVAR
jgi:hypothetical protein